MSAKLKQNRFKIMDSLAGIGSAGRLRAEKSRLEAFLSAVPGEYCGWSIDGSVAYSKGFCDALGVCTIENLNDIQNAIAPENAMAIEAMFSRLTGNGVPFATNVQDRSGSRTFRISGTRGQDLSGEDEFYVLWLEDITEQDTISQTVRDEQELLNQEISRLQDALDALPYPVWIRDGKQKIIWCNVLYSKMTKTPPSEVVAQQKEIISKKRTKKPGERGMVYGADLAAQAMKEGRTKIVEMHEVLGGKRLLLKISEIPVKDKNITLGFAEDLTDEENAQSEVKKNEAAVSTLLEKLKSAISIYDADQSLEFYNSSFAQLWRLEEGWLNTKPKLGDILEKLRETRMLPEQADFKSYKKSWLDMFTRLIDTHDDMLHLPDGSAFRMLVVPHKLGGLMMTFEDVTSRLELETSYNTLVAVQKETLDNLGEAIAVYGGDGRLRLWNPSFASLWGLDPEALEGSPHITKITDRMAGFFKDADWQGLKAYMISLGLEREVNKGRFDRIDDSFVSYVTVPLPDGGVLVSYSDVSDTVRVEKALIEKNAALQAAEKLKLDFLANVSYQLRTPLNAIMGFNEMLDKEFFGSLNDKQKEYTKDIDSSSKKLMELVNDILDLSTIEAGQMELDTEEYPVKDLMENILGLVGDWARKKKIEVSLTCPANIGKFNIDVTRMKQAIINLVRNAITHTQEGGSIELRASRTKENIKIIVKDNGPGISKEDQKRILQPFERIEGAQQNERGAGLGLSLVNNIASLHNGVFELDSDVGEGTSAGLIIPRA